MTSNQQATWQAAKLSPLIPGLLDYIEPNEPPETGSRVKPDPINVLMLQSRTSMKTALCQHYLQPLIKWPGGKRWLVPEIAAHAPPLYRRYIEPFAGGAAIFFGLKPDQAILSDINADLMEFYSVVARQPEELISRINALKNTETAYYRIRELVPTCELDRAARFLYLTRLSFNGIYRVNLKGEFNVPYGQKSWMAPCDPDHVRRCAEVLARATLLTADFRDVLRQAESGDFVYVDPPYTVAHNNNGFLKYNERIFSWNDQCDLAEAARSAAARGAMVIISNADHFDLRKLYSDFDQVTVRRFSSVSAESRGRKHVNECIFMRGLI